MPGLEIKRIIQVDPDGGDVYELMRDNGGNGSFVRTGEKAVSTALSLAKRMAGTRGMSADSGSENQQ
ncbi:hypothetical protein JXA63_05250 [Candidatus Woesebacteria bacterium]|nr:hypothetical protein [Candidatus Woesebacteria bacterium]